MNIFLRSLPKELLPTLRREYRLTTDAQKNVLCGSSLGGLAAAFIAYRSYPESIFGRVISQSGSYWWSPNYQQEPSPNPNGGWLIKQFAESKPVVPFYIEVGTWESGNMVAMNRLFASVLRGKGYSIRYSEFLGGHQYAYWRQTLPDALMAELSN